MLNNLWKCPRVILYNTAADFGYGQRQKPLPGFNFIFSVPTLVNWLSKARAENWEEVRICFTPIRGTVDPTELFADVCRLVADFGDVVFAVDEIWNFQSAGSSPKELRECFLQWRHYGLSLLWTAQVAQAVDKKLMSTSTEIYCGRLMAQNDLDAVERNGRLPQSAIAMVSQLPNYQFVHRNEAGEWRIEK